MTRDPTLLYVGLLFIALAIWCTGTDQERTTLPGSYALDCTDAAGRVVVHRTVSSPALRGSAIVWREDGREVALVGPCLLTPG